MKKIQVFRFFIFTLFLFILILFILIQGLLEESIHNEHYSLKEDSQNQVLSASHFTPSLTDSGLSEMTDDRPNWGYRNQIVSDTNSLKNTNSDLFHHFNHTIDGSLDTSQSFGGNGLVIHNDNELAAFPGSGTKEDPYVIEGYHFSNVSFATGISISQTTSHFIIKNNFISDVGDGITLGNVTNGRIENNTLSNNMWGIYLEESSNNIISNNIISPNSAGILVYYNSNDNYISDNLITTTSINKYRATGIGIYESNNITIFNNIMDKLQIGISTKQVQYSSISSNLISNIIGGINLASTSHSDIQANYAINSSEYGIEIKSSSSNIVKNNHIKNSTDYGLIFNKGSANVISDNNIECTSCYGIYLNQNYYGNEITNNTISKSSTAIYLYYSDENYIFSNYIIGSDDGIYLEYSHGNVIKSNTLSNNLDGGIYMNRSSNNVVSSNLLLRNTKFSISISNISDYNYIKYNNFVNNGPIFDEGSNNQFLYNYWSDWSGIDQDNDGIIDSQYLINSTTSTLDPFPKLTPFDFEADVMQPIVTFPSDLSYIEGSVGNKIVWEVGDENPGLYKVLINKTDHVSYTPWFTGSVEVNVDGLSSGNHTLILYVEDIYGNMISDIVLIEVESNFTTIVETDNFVLSSTLSASNSTSQTFEPPFYLIILFIFLKTSLTKKIVIQKR